MLTGCGVIYFSWAWGVCGCGASRWGPPTWAGLGFPGQWLFPNRGDIWLNRVTCVTLAVLSSAVGVPSTQNHSSHGNRSILSEPLHIKSSKDTKHVS